MQVSLHNSYNHPIINDYSLPYFQYIGIKNSITYYNTKTQNINSDFCFYINDYHIFQHTDIQNFITTFINSSYDLMLPKDIDMPFDLIPILFKNNKWMRNLISIYRETKIHNFKIFLEAMNLIDNDKILFHDKMVSTNQKDSLIKSMLSFDMNTIISDISSINQRLGII